jgi:succinate dehydrogenase/fumarate reductase cytochrome b subunit
MRVKDIESRLVRAQAIAGALFFVFLVLHLSNTLLAVFGPEIYNSYQRTIRQIYQHPFLEFALVIGPLFTHVVAGLWLYKIRKKWQFKRGLKYRIQTWSGFFLLFFVFGHMLATRGISFWYGPFAEFEGISFSLWWIPGYFYPYYFLLFMAGLYHGTMGAAGVFKGAFRNVLPERLLNSKLLPYMVPLFGAVGVVFALLGFGGFLFEIEDPRKNDYARQYSELMDIDLSTPLNKGR